MSVTGLNTMKDRKIKLPGTKFKKILKDWELYLLILPVVVYILVFCYYPMYGLQIAFKDYSVMKGFWGSTWVGLDHFKRFMESHYFFSIIGNTVGISLYQIVLGFPAPIILALMINELKKGAFKKSIQTITYAPHFLSVTVVVGMIVAFLSPKSGIVNIFLQAIGQEPIYFMTEPSWFKTIYVFSSIWQETGWGSIIYIAALSTIDEQQYEAATIDGASKFQKMWNISVPGILPTAIILLILNSGRIMSVGFEKIFLMQNDLNLKAADVISTYTYTIGLVGGQFSFSTAVGFFNSLVNCILLVVVNKITKKVSETSLW